MDFSRHFILLNGEPRTLQISSIEKNEVGGYRVLFKNSARSYNYGRDKVVWLNHPEWIAPTNSKVYIGGSQQINIREIWRFSGGTKYYWRIVHTNGYVQEGDDNRIVVATSCLGEQASKDAFAYLKNVALINSLGKDQDRDGILTEMYDKVDFVDKTSVAACYLNPKEHKPRSLTHADLIYPFGCNASQKKAVAAAFEHQMSVIQGPPGTGKTQTILNIIANIVRQGKTVLVVSNNNSATTNVMEKLEKYGTSFIVAPLGSKENKETFIANQPSVPTECNTWGMSMSDSMGNKQKLHSTLQQLDKVYDLQNERAELLQEQQTVELEWKHFCIDNNLDNDTNGRNRISSKRIISLWLEFQVYAKGEKQEPTTWFSKWKEKIKWWWMTWICKHRLHIVSLFNKNDLTPLIRELQVLYYQNRLEEINHRIASIERNLALYNAKDLTDTLTGLSMSLFKSTLHTHYAKHDRMTFVDTNDMRRRGNDFMQQYPVVLSTTFSARSCMFTEKLYDYIIMDEASQVSIDTGALALTCATNAVIVGDTLQLPNVVTDEDRMKLDAIMKQYNIDEGYDCAKNSFLQSVLNVI